MAERDEERPHDLRNGWVKLRPDWVAMVLSIGACIWNLAVYPERVGNNTRRIELLESDNAARNGKISEIDVKLGRMDEKLNILLNGKPYPSTFPNNERTGG